MSEAKREYAANYGRPPLHTRLKKGQSGNPTVGPRKNLPGLLVAALNDPVSVTTNGRRRKITKREGVIHQLVNKSTSADLRATKMLIDITKEVEQKAGMTPQPAPETPRLGPADKQVIKNLVEPIRQDILAEIAARKAGESGEGRRCERRRRRSHARKENPFMSPMICWKSFTNSSAATRRLSRRSKCSMRYFLSIPD
jgi:hypothetical protein